MNQSVDMLIEAACSGDKQALSQLLIVCQPDLKRFARHACSTSEDAEDAVQIALWQLYQKIGTLRTIAAFTGWLFRIVERECYRLFKTRVPHHDDEAIEQMIAPATDSNLHIDLTDAVASLPAKYRTVLILRDIEELTAPEVSKKLGISVETVKSRLHRGRTMLREHLISQGYS